MLLEKARDRLACGAELAIDLDAICRNWGLLQARVGESVECAAVIKADAYGLGAHEVAHALSKGGVSTFFVALPQEGLTARHAAPAARIYLLGGLFQGRAHLYEEAHLRPVLGALEEVEEWVTYCKKIGKPLPAAIQIDTGMNRLGLTIEEAETLSNDKELLSHFELSLVMSHLACSDEPEHPKNREQLDKFAKASALFPNVMRSLANSGGVFLGPDYHFDLVRPGIALYGGNPVAELANPMEATARVQAEVIHIRTVPAGESVGYGASRTTERETRIATISTGYADGFHRLLSSSDSNPSGSRVYINGHFAPIFGRISMDVLAVDVTDIPQADVYRGALAEIIGKHVTIDETATHAQTISYEILTGLGQRYHRTYKPL